MNHERLCEMEARVKRMEHCLDTVTATLAVQGRAALEDAVVGEMLQMLADYQASGLWLQDYEADEHGEFPQELKRGVLAQDTLYDLLTEICGQE